MSKKLKPLVALEEIKDRLFYDDYDEYCIRTIENALKKQEKDRKKVKALKIIKRILKEDGFIIMPELNETYQQYVNNCVIECGVSEQCKTKEEYDLLKEALL